MNKIKYIFLNILICSILFFTNNNNAKEILIFADNITYDEDENIIARGNAKIFQDNQYLQSDLIIYEKKNQKIILPTTFTLKDDSNNFLTGTEGFFEDGLNYGEFYDPKIKLSDGSRIIGKKIKRDGDIDIISKGVYSPCKSRIKIGNFICPTWQLEGEKILHDNKNLFLHQKHSKMRVINTPVFYIPYIVTPSPLRKNRKTGFLTPSLALNFFDTKTSQSISLPYYFNLDVDKELTFTPLINYGGGVDSSQRFNLDYNQLLSGGNLKTNLTFDSNFENKNSNKWLSDASLISNFDKNLNEKYKIKFNSALETSKNYIQITNPESELSYKSSLSSNFIVEGYNIKKIDDFLKINFSFYQTNQENEDNKTIPTVFPYINYNNGKSINNGFEISSDLEFYNIFRDKSTNIHSQKQQKFSHKYSHNKKFISNNTRFSFNSEIYNQVFNTENKKIEDNRFHTGSYYRLFPLIGINAELPFKVKNDKRNIIYKPSATLVITPGISNSNKLSNEDSSNNNLSIENINNLNRYSGTDKMDNSKRISYGFEAYNNFLKLKVSQYYEFTKNSNFHYEQGNDDNLSDIFGSMEYNKSNKLRYNFRYDLNEEYIKNQNIYMNSPTRFGTFELSYLDQNSKVDNILTKDSETINYNYKSKKINKFSNIILQGLYDLKKEINTEYKIGYSYFDDCFGINIDFTRKSYEEDTLKPQDILTLMFSFKNIGSYKSTNLAVSENDKQDIEWENYNIDNKLFQND